MSGSKVKFIPNKEGIGKILKSQMMMDATKVEGEKHGKYDTSFVGFDRVQVIVKEKDNAD